MKKIVITGCACSGKSTLIAELSKLGYPVIGESARQVIQESRQTPRTRGEILEREYKIAIKQLRQENYHNTRIWSDKTTFLDRSMVDIGAYCKYFLGQIPETIDSLIKESKYDLVFLLEKLPFKKDGVRFDKENKERETIEKLLVKTYIDYGHNMLLVPKVPLRGRIDFILRHIEYIKGGEKNVLMGNERTAKKGR